MMVNKNELIGILNNVAQASAADGLAFSDCFVFEKNKVMCFNGSVFIMQKTGLDIEAVLNVKNLLSVLKGLPNGDIFVEVTDTHVSFTAGEKNKSCVKMQKYSSNAGYTLADMNLPSPKKFNDLSPDTLMKMGLAASLRNDKEDDRMVTNTVCFRSNRIMSGNGPQAICCVLHDVFDTEIIVPRIHLKMVGTGYNKYYADAKCLYLYNKDTSLLCAVRTLQDAVYPTDEGFDKACAIDEKSVSCKFTPDANFLKALRRLKTTASEDNGVSMNITHDGCLNMKTTNAWGGTTEEISIESGGDVFNTKYDVQLFIDSANLCEDEVCLSQGRAVFYRDDGARLALASML